MRTYLTLLPEMSCTFQGLRLGEEVAAEIVKTAFCAAAASRVSTFSASLWQRLGPYRLTIAARSGARSDAHPV